MHVQELFQSEIFFFINSYYLVVTNLLFLQICSCNTILDGKKKKKE